MAHRRHSTVFAVLAEITELVQAAEYPAHDKTARLPWLDNKGLQPQTFDEYVTVVQAVEDGSSIAWTRVSPGGRDETVTVDIVIGTAVPGCTKLEVLARLGELADVVQALFYDPDTHVFTPPDLGDESAVQLGGGIGVSTVLDATTEGHVGQASIRYEFQARI